MSSLEHMIFLWSSRNVWLDNFVAKCLMPSLEQSCAVETLATNSYLDPDTTLLFLLFCSEQWSQNPSLGSCSLLAGAVWATSGKTSLQEQPWMQNRLSLGASNREPLTFLAILWADIFGLLIYDCSMRSLNCICPLNAIFNKSLCYILLRFFLNGEKFLLQ